MGISSMAPDTPRTTETTKHQWSYPGRHEGTPTPQKLTAYKKWWWYSQKVFPLSHSLSRYAMPLFWVLKNWVYIAIEAMAHFSSMRKMMTYLSKMVMAHVTHVFSEKKTFSNPESYHIKLASDISSIPKKNPKKSPHWSPMKPPFLVEARGSRALTPRHSGHLWWFSARAPRQGLLVGEGIAMPEAE